MEFQRFTTTDAAQLESDIGACLQRLAEAQDRHASLDILDHCTDLGSLLTTARREAEALELLRPQVARAQAHADTEVASWFWCAYGTALQYTGRRDLADDMFARALVACESGGWRKLQAMVHQHRGRCQVEQGEFDLAQINFEAALRMRRELGDPRQASSERALAGLELLRNERREAGL